MEVANFSQVNSEGSSVSSFTRFEEFVLCFQGLKFLSSLSTVKQAPRANNPVLECNNEVSSRVEDGHLDRGDTEGLFCYPRLRTKKGVAIFGLRNLSGFEVELRFICSLFAFLSPALIDYTFSDIVA